MANPIIRRNEPIIGRSGDSHNIDVVWTFNVGPIPYTTLISAKYWKTRVKMSHIREMCDIVSDVPGQPRAVIVTSHGYQSGALKYAISRGVCLWNVRDSGGVLTLPEHGAKQVLRLKCVPFEMTYVDGAEQRKTIRFSTQSIVRSTDIRVVEGNDIVTLDQYCEEALASRMSADLWDGEDPRLLIGKAMLKKAEVDVDAYVFGSKYKVDSVVVAATVERHRIPTPKPRLSALFMCMVDDLTSGAVYGVGPGMDLTLISSDQLRQCDICGVPVPSEKIEELTGPSYTLRLDESHGKMPGWFDNGYWRICRPCYGLAERGEREGLVRRAMLLSSVLGLQYTTDVVRANVNALLECQFNGAPCAASTSDILNH